MTLMTTDNYSERQRIEKLYHDEKYRDEAEEHNARAGNIKRAFTRFWGIISQAREKTILDFGCGTGWLTVALAKRGNRVYSFDISEVLVERARQLAADANVSDRVTIREMAGENLDFPPETFDLVVGSAVLHHTELPVTLSNIKRVLKHSGTAVFLEPLNQNLALSLWRRLTPWRRSATERAFSQQDLETVRTHFPSVRMTYYSLTSIVAIGLLLLMPKSRVVMSVNDRLDDFDEWLLRVWPALGRFSAVVLLEMRK
jgi:SAM-dependent methyltransferase